jgi:hypothetical protein
MNRPFYSEYVRHCLRFYTRNLEKPPFFKSDADKDNWLSCAAVLKDYADKDREVLITVYSGYDTLADNVYEIAKKLGINQAIIWDMMKDVERKIAKRRGLM